MVTPKQEPSLGLSKQVGLPPGVSLEGILHEFHAVGFCLGSNPYNPHALGVNNCGHGQALRAVFLQGYLTSESDSSPRSLLAATSLLAASLLVGGVAVLPTSKLRSLGVPRKVFSYLS